jgi:hypothetical protein
MSDADDDMKAAEQQMLDKAGIPNIPAITDMPLDMTHDEKLRMTALMMAVSYHKETIVKDGQMYQTMKAQGTNLRASSPKQVVDAAIVFEAYLRGHFNELVASMVLGAQGAIDEFLQMPDSAAEQDGAE